MCLPLWNWRAFLADASCVLTEESDRICGVLVASSDESPAAWVRLAAVEDGLDIGRWLDLSLPRLLGDLRALGAREVVWMDYGEWAGPYLSARGFTPLVEVITLTKAGHGTPGGAAGGITLRAARRADLEPIVDIDRAAFKPYWWRSTATLERRAARASRFTVAERGGEVVGYAEWELHLPIGHLNRIAVHPDEQSQGVGRLLLSDVVHTVWRSGVEELSLNTQRHNRRARRLYDAFGFRATGDVAKVWTLRI